MVKANRVAAWVDDLKNSFAAFQSPFAYHFDYVERFWLYVEKIWQKIMSNRLDSMLKRLFVGILTYVETNKLLFMKQKPLTKKEELRKNIYIIFYFKNVST